MNEDEVKELLVSVYNRYKFTSVNCQPVQQIAAKEASRKLMEGLTVDGIRPLLTTLCKFCMFGEPPCSTTKDLHK